MAVYSEMAIGRKDSSLAVVVGWSETNDTLQRGGQNKPNLCGDFTVHRAAIRIWLGETFLRRQHSSRLNVNRALRTTIDFGERLADIRSGRERSPTATNSGTIRRSRN
jgi:hypothetical protein